MTIFLRLLETSDKQTALVGAVAALRQGVVDNKVFTTDPVLFRLVPMAPFAYWVARDVLEMFSRHPSCGNSRVDIKQGLATADDPRFLRAFYEFPCLSAKWPWLAKGGSYSLFYSSVHLLVNWKSEGREITENRNSSGKTKSNIWMLRDTIDKFFFQPGLTWPRRTQSGLGMRVLPRGCIFSDRGPSIFSETADSHELLSLLAITTSRPFCHLVELQMAFGSYEVGVIQRTPIPELNSSQRDIFARLARQAWSIQRQIDTVTEVSQAFELPLQLQAMRWGFTPLPLRVELERIRAEIDTRCFDLYGFSEVDRLAAQVATGNPSATDAPDADLDDDDDGESTTDTASDSANQRAAVISWAIGVAFGRFDIRLALPGSTRPAEPEPFDPLPACSPGMLAGPDGQPARVPPVGYPIAWPTDGILVDDPGHDRDLIARMRQVFTVIFGDEAETRWQEAAVALDPTEHDLRTWLRRQAFERHLKTHSKSRRKAPLYWPLSIPSGQYTVWIYAHRVTADTLFAITSDWVKPKAEAEALKLARMVADAGPNPSGAQRQELEAQETLATELRTLQTDLTQLTPLLQPFFDDGIVVWSSPLWPLITTHAGWQKELRTTWAALAAGEYDWAQLAMRLWPERVIPKCADDRSLAIAHDLEAVFWHQDADEKWVKTPVPVAEIQRLIRERQVPAIITARDWLLARPTDRPAARRRNAAPAAPTRRASARAESPIRAEAPAPVEAPPRPAAPAPAIDAKLLDRLVEVIASYPDGVGKSEILAATGVPPTAWNAAIAALLDSGRVTRSGEKRGTKYHRNPSGGV